MTSVLPTTEATPVAAHFEAFAREHAYEALYARLAQLVVQHPRMLQLLDAAPPTQRRPTLFFAAIHDQLLALREQDASEMPALAAYFPSLGGDRRPDDDQLPAALEDFITSHGPALQATIASRTTQTNEVGRSAVLWPALSEIAERHDNRPLALFDFGCSAGLNLSVDAFRIEYRQRDGSLWQAIEAVDPQTPTLRCRVLGGTPSLAPWRIEARMGVDCSPVALDDERALRWLRACLWPSERERAERFERALRQARLAKHPVLATDDGVAVLSSWLRELPPDVTPVLFDSWVLTYFTADELTRHVERVQALIREHGLVWLSADDDQRLRATTGLQTPVPAGPTEPGTPTWWSITERDGSGGLNSRLLARSHPHGAWLDWLA
jgi:hypothetical protein